MYMLKDKSGYVSKEDISKAFALSDGKLGKSRFIKKNFDTINHMFGCIKLNGGYLIQFHTSHPTSHIGNKIVMQNFKGDNIIKYSNELVFIKSEILDKYTQISFSKNDFPTTFKKNYEETKKSLYFSLKKSYWNFISSKGISEDMVNDKKYQSLEFSYKVLNIDDVNTDIQNTILHKKIHEDIMVGTHSEILPKNYSKIFLSTQNMTVDHFANIHEKFSLKGSKGLNNLIKEISSDWF